MIPGTGTDGFVGLGRPIYRLHKVVNVTTAVVFVFVVVVVVVFVVVVVVVEQVVYSH